MPRHPQLERFKISCEVEASALGPIVAQLTKLGLINVHFELVTDIRRFAKNNAPSKTNDLELTGAEFLTAWIAEHPTFKVSEAVKHFEANSRTAGSAYAATKRLVETKVLRKIDSAHYSRADIKALAGPKKKIRAKKTAALKAKSAKRYDISHTNFILKAIRRGHGKITMTKLKELFSADKRPPSSVSPAIADLEAQKVLKRLGGGSYELIAKTNGDASEAIPTEMVDHG